MNAPTHALTLQMPWADLIAHADKRIENRGWRPHAGVTRILIHSGKAWDDYLPDWVRPIMDKLAITPSAVLAVADISGVCEASRYSDSVVCGCGRWANPGQVHWQLANVIALPEPVPHRGSRGLWPASPALIDAVDAQLEAARRD